MYYVMYISFMCVYIASVGTNFALGGSWVADYYGHGFIEYVGRTMCFLFVVWSVAAKKRLLV